MWDKLIDILISEDIIEFKNRFTNCRYELVLVNKFFLEFCLEFR